MILRTNFYRGNNVVEIARNLIGKTIYTKFDDRLTGGIISETEAYAGVVDKASHAYNNRRTKRTETLYQQGGIGYVYLCYGIHHLFNFVTNNKDIPEAVLLRGIIPTNGIENMQQRMCKSIINNDFSNGPGKVTRALGITTENNGFSLLGPEIWVEDKKNQINGFKIECGPRIGIDYAGEDALLPYRFVLKSI